MHQGLTGLVYYGYRFFMKTRFSHRLTIAALVGAFALGACGIKGDLDTPPPLWGDKTKKVEKKPESNN